MTILNYDSSPISYSSKMKLSSKYILLLGVLILASGLLTSCFTGIESTKKINLSREDKKNIKPSEEELFYPGITGIPLQEWEEGHKFLATDDKAILIFESHYIPYSFSDLHLEGDTLSFSGIESRIDAAGNITVSVDFVDSQYKYPYNTGKTFDAAMSNFLSSQIPMLIDLEMVEKAKEKLVGHKLWTRTFLWYDESGERINGKKFVPVTIIDVLPGNMVFPFKLKINDENGLTAYMYMNAGISPTDSRAFPVLFSMTDIRKNYPSVSDKNWELICGGDVAVGMTKEECKLALGNPKDVSAGHDYSQTLDIWSYENGTVLWFEDGLLSRFRK